MTYKPSVITVTCLSIGTLVALAVASALWLGLSSAADNTRRLLEQQVGIFMDLVEQRIESRLRPAVDQALWISQRVSDGTVDLDDNQGFDKFMRGALAATPQVAGITHVAPDGLSRRWRRIDSLSITEQWSDRPGIVEWLELGASGSMPNWREPFYTDTIGEYVVLHDTALRADGEFKGMIGQIIPITDLSFELVKLVSGTPLIPFVLYDKTRVLAHPSIVQGLDLPTQPNAQLPELQSLYDPVLKKIWTNDMREMRLLGSVDNVVSRMTWTDDSAFAIMHRTIDRYGDTPWVIGFYFDLDSEDNTVIDRLIAAVLAGLGVFCVSVIVSILLGKRLGRPITSIANVANQIGGGDFENVDTLPGSRVREIHSANISINKMVSDLREQKVIRDTLGRYLPEPVARSILKEHGELAPQTSVATVLFCDVAGFTSLSESFGAEATVEVLNAYFSDAVSILEKHQGIVTQFQGDGILAVFNLPLTNPNHAYSAVMAALEIVDCVGHKQFSGIKLSVRIGICTGEVVAGAVGATGRLTYTVHGDAVNSAARIETINKTTGTNVLISASTATQLQQVRMRSIGNFDIRGKSSTTELFTVEHDQGAAQILPG
jgi:class 3 adenylate cyclase